MIRNRKHYEALGAKLPQGVLLYGEPGLGKTLMANCFIEECGLESYTIRRNKGKDSFIEEITNTFRWAKANAPAIVFLDDLDKFANEDNYRRDAEEYIAVQAGIDEVKGYSVFVLATANDIDKLPTSLKRSGRFDRRTEVCAPSRKEATEIIRYYLKDKKVAEDICVEDISMMIQYSSCAELETILNEAAIRAAYERKSSIDMKDLVRAVLAVEYEAPEDYSRVPEAKKRRVAVHEAGHMVISEVLCPGSVGMVSLRAQGSESIGGFTRRCTEMEDISHYVLVFLGGKAASELHYADGAADGCYADLEEAAEEIRRDVSYGAKYGLSLLNMKNRFSSEISDELNAKTEAVVHAELERLFYQARSILLKNWNFLQKTVDALMEKETLLYSDIRALREASVLQKDVT